MIRKKISKDHNALISMVVMTEVEIEKRVLFYFYLIDTQQVQSALWGLDLTLKKKGVWGEPRRGSSLERFIYGYQ